MRVAVTTAYLATKEIDEKKFIPLPSILAEANKTFEEGKPGLAAGDVLHQEAEIMSALMFDTGRSCAYDRVEFLVARLVERQRGNMMGEHWMAVHRVRQLAFFLCHLAACEYEVQQYGYHTAPLMLLGRITWRRVSSKSGC